MSEAELTRFLEVKNNALSKTGQRVCVNKENAYQNDVVPASTSVNLLQSQILCHLKFDIGNDTENCNAKINKRLADSKKANYEAPPVMWTNQEFVATISLLFAICIGSIIMNLILCLPLHRRGGSRRDIELN